MILYLIHVGLRPSHGPLQVWFSETVVQVHVFIKNNNCIRNEVDSLTSPYQREHHELFELNKSALAALVLSREHRKIEMIRNSSLRSLPPAFIGIPLKVNHLLDCPHLSFPLVNLEREAGSYLIGYTVFIPFGLLKIPQWILPSLLGEKTCSNICSGTESPVTPSK